MVVKVRCYIGATHTHKRSGDPHSTSLLPRPHHIDTTAGRKKKVLSLEETVPIARPDRGTRWWWCLWMVGVVGTWGVKAYPAGSKLTGTPYGHHPIRLNRNVCKPKDFAVYYIQH
jgi:hypothetical protein